MGTGVTIDIPEAKSGDVFEAVFERLKEIDNRFSTYKKNSEVSRFADGQIAEADLSGELKQVIAACREAEARTNGCFSAWYKSPELAGQQGFATPNKYFDPSGYVKAWAIAEAGKLIEKAGFATYCISIGGDIMAAGTKQWRIGIQDPGDKAKIVNKLSISNSAVCTSGNYVRGAHIIDPQTGLPADELRAVTVVGADIVKTDVLATAAFVAGAAALDFIKVRAPGYDALVMYKDGRQASTPGLSRYLA